MPPRALVVLSPQRSGPLLEMLQRKVLLIDRAGGFLDAREKLSGPIRYELIFVDAELQDGFWRDLLQVAHRSGGAVQAIVCARLGDHRLWADALQSGAYDLLTEPYDPKEVSRIVEGALNRSSVGR